VTRYGGDAAAAIQAVFDDPTQEQLAERIDEMLDLLDKDPGDQRLRRFRMQAPKLWVIRVRGSGRDFVLLWDDDAEPFVRYAGEAF
jgi:hypothetical protein